ncbi:MAG: hypothetical protein GY711_11975 [bacterium]|nr:hypothetical protein [bacterium]
MARRNLTLILGRALSYIVTETGGSQGLGFTITTKTCRERLIDRSPLWSGMTLIPLEGRLASILNLPKGRSGWLVQRVAKDSPAAKLGLKGGDVPAVIAGQPLLLGGDVLLEVMSEPVAGMHSSDSLMSMVQGLGDEGKFQVTVLRGGVLGKLERRWGDLQ